MLQKMTLVHSLQPCFRSVAETFSVIEIGENKKSGLVTQFFTPHYCDLQFLRVRFGPEIPNEVSSAISPSWTILLSYSC